MFRWTCLALAALFSASGVWMLNDVRLELRRSSGTVNAHLPQILEKTQRTTDTLAALSEDIRQLREMTGAADVARDEKMTAFADQVLDLVRDSGGTIGLKKKVFGSGLKNAEPAAEWVVGARKEALWLLVRARTKARFLEMLCDTFYGSPWHIQIGDAEPVPLCEWIEKNLPEEAKP